MIQPLVLSSLALASSLAPPGTGLAGSFRISDLASDGSVPADHLAPDLVDPWGMADSPDGPFWIVDRGTGTATQILGDGLPVLGAVAIPIGRDSSPTGVVFNTSSGFVIHRDDREAPSRFVVATADGMLLGYQPDVAPNSAIIAADLSSRGAAFLGLAEASLNGQRRLFATDFANGRVDVFDEQWQSVGSFTDPDVPRDFAPYGIARIGDLLVVTFAKRRAGTSDDAPGIDRGYVDAFAADGTLLKRIASRDRLNSPWGLARAPAGFGRLGGALLVGNSGDGTILAIDLQTGTILGLLVDEHEDPLVIPGLRSLRFGNGEFAGDPSKLYFTAGPRQEQHGLFGSIEVTP